MYVPPTIFKVYVNAIVCTCSAGHRAVWKMIRKKKTTHHFNVVQQANLNERLEYDLLAVKFVYRC